MSHDHSIELKLLAENPGIFPFEFAEWFMANLHVWRAFCAEAFKVRARGHKRYSARTIIHVLRHHSAVSECSDAGWKINNDHSPYLARMFDLRYPSMAGMWEYRQTRMSDRYVPRCVA